ncbi:penicillin-binding protein 2 [Halovulum sp. GXIMD14793]
MTRRGTMLLGFQFLVIGGLGLRMRQLQVEQADTFRLLAEENRINIRLLAPARGLIFDRNGSQLAVNEQNYRVTMVREQAGDPATALDRLARLIPLTEEERDKALKELTKRPGHVEITVAEHLDWDHVARIAANAPALPGISPAVGLTRAYPLKDTTAHIVGYVGPVSDRDLERIPDPDPVLTQVPDFQIGKTGVELKSEDDLRGKAGNRRIEVNAAGRIMRELGRTEGTSGQDMHLTIDAKLQEYAIRRMGDESAAAVVLDVQTGDIMASASAPSFDPNAFVFGISLPDWNALLNDDHRPLSNKAVSGAYPPGSTFKMVVLLAALEAGVLNPNETVYCPGHYQLGNRRFHCWRRGGHGHVDLHESLKGSCDVFYYDIARRVGIDEITKMANRLGIGVRYDLPMPAIHEGLTPTRDWKKRTRDEDWLIGDTLNSGIGQGFVLATPLQLAVMTARIATGKVVMPRLVRALDGAPLPVPEMADLGIAPQNLGHARIGMDQVVNTRRGTGYRSRIVDPENRMAGKTGTSQVRIITKEERARGVTRNKDLPWERRDHALFVCYAPFDKPRYATAVVVEHGGGGSVAAAPIARDIMMHALYEGPAPLSAYPANLRPAIEQQREAEPETPPETGPRSGSDRA